MIPTDATCAYVTSRPLSLQFDVGVNVPTQLADSTFARGWSLVIGVKISTHTVDATFPAQPTTCILYAHSKANR